MLKFCHAHAIVEAGVDEVGRGCLAGPVVAAAVVLFEPLPVQDSKQLSAKTREELKKLIVDKAACYGVGWATPTEIDQINILNASFLAMHRAIKKLKLKPELLLIDGNRFKPFPPINHLCIVKGDSKYQSIAAASIIAKTWRDRYMARLAKTYPYYGWEHNFGYPTVAHRQAIEQHGLTIHHRKTFKFQPSSQATLF